MFKQARKQWILSNAPLRGMYRNLFDLLLDCSNSLGKEELELFCVILWRVWTVHNAMIHGVLMADVCEVNCDAAIDIQGGRIGFGSVIRDSTGFVMDASSQVMVGSFNAQVAETIAILRGIQFSKDCRLFPCIFESDAELVVRWINDGSHMDSLSGAILSDIKFMAAEMSGVCFGFVPRNALMLIEDRFWM
ncbi:hypothetical protein Dsin_010003 [Dipteronia sinensis]|uniref:RNase H type-1 domain-containing protein n=1 Tax=Dipteronia sinensis TaxID=43782 RepID=A0AAE0ARZ8_9ROSI|nr:hypothetical protein Dsin_010003 [Dipteronia sinensis]